ncbi:inositol monophosphatase family protein [Nocardioides panaciterrulae]|uniref:Fructose-1,6-bisphosphatase/inositol monophosphatase family enzyme n=1 Tax=Nocardioides panaciterrulae TaxID=661492 RepID=A0A7Y9JAU8_9ACTN|nr:inositol monophosphatase family protein [Nocardioides panaciterrulae]NYD42112.1 fructose-1,6-bisphosphatase/inositol monophosphatase family enzyme [Nocardioides panaciterrulae]
MTGSLPSLAADAALAGELVREAGRLAARMRRGGLEAEQKTSVSDLVTDADHAAERLVVERLGRERPEDGILGEEGTDRTSTSGRSWVIDPVDGTYNFHRGLSWWCSAIALVDGEDVLLGAIYHPHDDVLFVGGPQLPSTRNGAPMAALVDVSLGETCASTYLHPPYDDHPRVAAFSRVASRVATLRMLGSASMDATAIAQGQLGVSFQHGVADWDRLPGAAIIRGVGGVARQVEAGGVTWSVAGAATAVAEACEALAGRG